MERRSKPPLAGASGQLNIINLHGQQPGKPCNIRAGDSPSTLGTDPKRWFWRETKDEGRELSVHLPRRLTHPRIPIKLEESNRGCPDPREGAAIPFCSCLLVGRPIGRTPDSGSKASSPPAIFFNDLRCAELPKVAYFLFSLVKKSVKNCTKIGQSVWRKLRPGGQGFGLGPEKSSASL